MTKTSKSNKSRTPALLFFVAVIAIAGFYFFEKNQESKEIMRMTAPMPLEAGEDKEKTIDTAKAKKKVQNQ